MNTIDKIFDLISKKGIAQKDLAKYLGINTVVITDWKTGKSKSYPKYINEIAKFFNVSTDYLLYEESYEKTNTSQQIAERIQSITKEKSISINKMLQDCNLSKKVVDNMKTGSMPSADKLATIACYLNIPITFLLGIAEEENAHRNMSDGELDSEIVKLANSLSPKAQEKAISYLRYLINEGEQ